MYLTLETDVRGVVDEALRQLVIPGEVALRISSVDGITVRLEVESYRNLDGHEGDLPDDSSGIVPHDRTHDTAETACPQSQ